MIMASFFGSSSSSMPQCAHKWLLRLLLLFLYFRGHYTWDRPTRRHRPMSEATSERKDKPTLLVFNAPAVTAAERAAAFFRYYGLAASVLRWCYHPSLLLYCYHPNQSFTYITLKVSWSSKLFEKFNAEKKAWLEKWGHFFKVRVAKNILLFPPPPFFSFSRSHKCKWDCCFKYNWWEKGEKGAYSNGVLSILLTPSK